MNGMVAHKIQTDLQIFFFYISVDNVMSKFSWKKYLVNKIIIILSNGHENN